MEAHSLEGLEQEAADALIEAAGRLEAVLVELARGLRPFPAFLGMVSVQAVEVDPPGALSGDLGCVVVDPEGQFCALEITTIDGIVGLTETEQVEEFQPLELGPLDYVIYASTAIELLVAELKKRGQAGRA